jgi:hypothetical protein
MTPPIHEKRRNFFCRICCTFAEHILLENVWHCCHCNPLLLEGMENDDDYL